MSAELSADELPSHPPPEIVQVLVNNHRQFLTFLEKRLGSRALAEDILQDAFVRGMHKLDTLRSDESAIAWFYRLLRNAVIDHRRRAGTAERRLTVFGKEVEDRVEPDADLRGAICGCVAQLAGTLKEEYAEALRKVDVEEFAIKDFAAAAGITPNNASVRVSRAREALRKQVMRSCGTCAEHGCLDCTCESSPSGGSSPATSI
jgi:RNA polymerase sigma factor (sigma-70 family)